MLTGYLVIPIFQTFRNLLNGTGTATVLTGTMKHLMNREKLETGWNTVDEVEHLSGTMKQTGFVFTHRVPARHIAPVMLMRGHFGWCGGLRSLANWALYDSVPMTGS